MVAATIEYAFAQDPSGSPSTQWFLKILGEDVGRKGGVFGATEGLWAKYGEKRVLDTPLTEGMIAGAAAGAGPWRNRRRRGGIFGYGNGNGPRDW